MEVKMNVIRARELANLVLGVNRSSLNVLNVAKKEGVAEIYVPLNTNPLTIENLLSQDKPIDLVRGREIPQVYTSFRNARREEDYDYFLVIEPETERVIGYIDRRGDGIYAGIHGENRDF